MYKSKTVVVVIPAHNEESSIARVIDEIPGFADRIVVVDDASVDGTAHRVKTHARSGVELISLPANRGVGGAMAAGYRRALESGADIVVKMDGDGQMDPAHLSDLLDGIIEENADYAKGNRFLGRGLGRMPVHRLLANIAMTLLTKIASGYWHVFDPQNGYTAIRAKNLARIDLNDVHPGYFFENDMLVHLYFSRARVIDVPTSTRYGDEVSDIDPVRILMSFPLLLFRRFMRRFVRHYILQDFSPIALYSFFGLGLLAAGAGFGAFHWVASIKTGVLTSSGTIALAGLPIILGFQLLLQAVALDIANTPK